MSMGFGFRAKLEESDGKAAVYRYRTYDLSYEEGRQGYGAVELDGVIWVTKDGDDLSCEVERYSRFAPERSHLYDRARLAQRLFLKIRRGYLQTESFPETIAADW